MKTIRWNDATRQTILAARDQLVRMGVPRPSIRMVLYLLLELPGWTKRHYNTLCARLGEWRDRGLLEFGLFADDGAGTGYRPLTAREIAERIRDLQDLIPAQLGPDNGVLNVVFVEHLSLVDLIAGFLDWAVPVVSSQGQIRREHLHSFLSGCVGVVEELGGSGVQIVGLTDYDKGGLEIFNTHQRWARRIFEIPMARWAVTEQQVRAAKLPDFEPHQLDGWMARYGIDRFKRELRERVGL